MKFIYLILNFIIVGHNLAQDTYFQPEKQDFTTQILHELKSTSTKLTSIAEEVKTLVHQKKSMEQLIMSLIDSCSCLELKKRGVDISGVYTIYINKKGIQVYCDMETDGGGWLVFQRRTDGSEDFYRGWGDYKDGFGNLTNEFWLGNDKLFQILQACGKHHELRIDLGDFDNATRYATYSTFTIADEADNYRIQIGGYSGNAGNALAFQNGQQFSTLDRDNDPHGGAHCAELYKGAWWYQRCHRSNLNGLYLKGSSVYGEGMNWVDWRGYHYSLRFTEMKIRPNTCN